jgi:hypothetical protein
MYVMGIQIRPIDSACVEPAEPAFELLVSLGEGRVMRKPIIGWAND